LNDFFDVIHYFFFRIILNINFVAVYTLHYDRINKYIPSSAYVHALSLLFNQGEGVFIQFKIQSSKLSVRVD